MLRNAAGSAAVAKGQAQTADLEAEKSETVDDLQLDRLDLLKINSGIVATHVLTGAAATLWRLRPVVFVVVADEEALVEADAHLREFGYRCWRMESPWFNSSNFNRRDEDIFAGRTALALVAIPEEMEGDMAQFGCAALS